MINEFMTADHRRCDKLFADIESAILAGSQATATDQINEFHFEMERHFAMEEEILFPTFEQVTGMTIGPTAMMLHEHSQMRQMLQKMSEGIATGDTGNYLGIAETLLVMMQQHNMKEEQVLYPMIDKSLSEQRGEIVGRLREMSV